MRIVSLIDDRTVLERILRHLGLGPALRSLGVVGAQGVRVHSGTDPSGPPVIEPCLDDPFPDYDTESPVVSDVEPVMVYANG
jgi:hypothetical protein